MLGTRLFGKELQSVMMSELAARTSVAVPTIKYYLREGVLMAGRATSATRAEYEEPHVRRIALIRALLALGLSMTQIKSITGLIDKPGESLFDALRAATAMLPSTETASPDRPRARAALAALDCVPPEDLPAIAQLEQALAAAEAAGVPMTEDRLRVYAPHIAAMAEYDIEQMPLVPASAAIEYAVLGSVLYEPILAALRRIAHAQLAAQRLADPDDALENSSPKPPTVRSHHAEAVYPTGKSAEDTAKDSSRRRR